VGIVTARPDPFRTHVADQVLAALAEAGTPLPTPALQERTGYGPRYGQLVYQVLTRLAADGEVEKVSAPGTRPVYWRRLVPVICLPPPVICTDRDRRRPS
jgi:hypothetical protein